MADITYCGLACDNKDCKRNYCHILGDDRPHSIVAYYECKKRMTKSQYKRIKIQQESEETE